MKQSNSWDSNRFTDSSEISLILYGQKAEKSSHVGVFLHRLHDPEGEELCSSKTLGTCLPVEKIKHPKKTGILYSENLKSPRLKVHHCFTRSNACPYPERTHPVLLSIVLKGTQHMFFSLYTKPGFIPIQNIRQNYSFLYFNIYGFSGKGRDITLWIEW